MCNFTKLSSGVYELNYKDGKRGVLADWYPPKTDALIKMGEAEHLEKISGLAVKEISDGILITLPLAKKERIYGFGLQYFKQNQRGRTRFLRVNSDPVADTGESNAPVPYFVSSLSYALYIDTSKIVTVYCGSVARTESKAKLGEKSVHDGDFEYTPPSDTIEIFVRDKGVRLLAFFGGSMLECVRRYNLFCGGGVLPPKWELGFWHRVDGKYNAQNVIDEAAEFKRRSFPCDVIGLEPSWQQNVYPCSLTWNRELYSDPVGLKDRLSKMGMRINLWQHPYLSQKCPVYNDAKDYSSDYTVWGGLVPDLTTEKGRELLSKVWKDEQLPVSSGMKIDECDGSENTKFSWIFPPHAKFPGGDDGEEYRQKFGCLVQKLSDELYKAQGVRTYGLARASGGGAAPLPFALYTDLYDHRQFIRALINGSYSGMNFSPEVRSAESEEDWVRRFQTAALSPLSMLNGWCDSLRPWSYENSNGLIREALFLRMRLIPYLYTAYHKYETEGIPVFKAMNLQGDYDPEKMRNEYIAVCGYRKERPWDTFEDELDSQYMIGDDLLFAPLVAGEKEKIIYLPRGKWYDFFTGEEFAGGRFIKRAYKLGEIPLFACGGSIIPLFKSAMNTESQSNEIEAVVFGKGEARGEVYFDDGETFEYRDGKYTVISLYTSGKGKEKTAILENGYNADYKIKNWIYR